MKDDPFLVQGSRQARKGREEPLRLSALEKDVAPVLRPEEAPFYCVRAVSPGRYSSIVELYENAERKVDKSRTRKVLEQVLRDATHYKKFTPLLFDARLVRGVLAYFNRKELITIEVRYGTPSVLHLTQGTACAFVVEAAT